MKFLVMMTPRDPLFHQPFSVQRQIITSHTDALNRQFEQGIITEVYLTYEQGTGCTVAIYQCQSHEELMEYVNQTPAVGLYKVNIYPLIDFNRALEIASKNMENIDFMPGGTVK